MPDAREPPMKWERWTDFRPGIISQARFSYGSSDNAAPVPFLAGAGSQPAAAQPDGTYGCIALANGGLAPMPGPVGTVTGPSAAFQDGFNNYITGVLVYGPIGTASGQGDELLYCIDSINGSNNRLQAICATQTAGAWNRVLVSKGPTSTSNFLGVVAPFTAGMTMVNASDPTGAATGTAVVAMTTQFVDNAGSPTYLGIYPDPTNPGGTATPKDYSADLPAGPGFVLLCHQNRIILLQGNSYPWTVSTASLGGPYDQWFYTDPPNTVPGNGAGDSLAQDVVFVQEWPVGAGAWGSISASELFIVKGRGGGYIVSGDLNFPTVTWLGGVQPTLGASIGLAASTPIGYAYLSLDNGCWLWNGTSQAQKISQQLNDDFYFPNPRVPSFGPYLQAIAWDELLLVSNNWVYDTLNGGWWKLDNQAVSYTWYGIGASNNTELLYAFPALVTAHTQPIAYKYSKTAPATTWQWTSYPLQVSTNMTVKPMEVVVRAQGNGTVTVTLQGIAGAVTASVPVTMTLTGETQPVSQRFIVGAYASAYQDLTVIVQSVGVSSGPAPILYGLSIGYEDGNPLNVT